MSSEGVIQVNFCLICCVQIIRSDQYVRVGGLYVLPALAKVLLEFVERAEAKFPLQVYSVSLFG